MISIGRIFSEVRKDFAYKLKTRGIYTRGFTNIVTFKKSLKNKCKDFKYGAVSCDKILRFLAGKGLCVRWHVNQLMPFKCGQLVPVLPRHLLKLYGPEEMEQKITLKEPSRYFTAIKSSHRLSSSGIKMKLMVWEWLLNSPVLLLTQQTTAQAQTHTMAMRHTTPVTTEGSGSQKETKIGEPE